MDSGDLDYLAEGELSITGRRKDLIIKGGRNLYPQEVEEVVASGELSHVGRGRVTGGDRPHRRRAGSRRVAIAEDEHPAWPCWPPFRSMTSRRREAVKLGLWHDTASVALNCA